MKDIIKVKIITFFLLFISCKQNNEQLLHSASDLQKKQKYNEAIQTLNKVIANNSNLQSAYYNRGLVYIEMKQYSEALADFDKVITLQTHGNARITYNPNAPFASEEIRFQIPYDDALYNRAIAKYFMDSLKSSFIDFQDLLDRNYERSNCLLWQGMIYIQNGNHEKACSYFSDAKRVAITDEQKNDVIDMITTYCSDTTTKR